MLKYLFVASALMSFSSPAIGQEFGEKSIFETFDIGESMKIRMLCSAAKEDGYADEVQTVATTVTGALPGYVQAVLLKGLDEAAIVSPGEAYCAVIATSAASIVPAGGISGGSVYTSAVRDGKITATETDDRACKYLNKTGVCWEEVSSGSDELTGVVGCFEARDDGDLFSVVLGRADILKSVGIDAPGQAAQSCEDRGLALR